MRGPRTTMLLVLALPAVFGCARSSTATAQQAAAPAASDSTLVLADTIAANGLPTGYGSLRQDDIAIKVQVGGKQVKILPLDERVLRTMSPDSYRALRGLQESRQAQIAEIAKRAGASGYSLWYVSFYGIEPEARFSPRDLTITSGGREFRPVDVIAVSSGFGTERLQQREVQSAIYLFDGAIEVNQPITVTVEATANSSWADTLRRIERERSLIRSRAPKGRTGS